VIVHLVLFHPRTSALPEQREALADALVAALQEIPSIRRVRVGRRVTHGREYEHRMAVDYSYAAFLEFDDAAGLEAYLRHPAHEPLAARFYEVFDEALMYDYRVIEGKDGVAALRSPEP
jgi:hypothetical protein